MISAKILVLLCACALAVVGNPNAPTHNVMSGIHINGDTTYECTYNPCPPGWEFRYPMCFLARPKPATHSEAEADCASIGAVLGVGADYSSDRVFLTYMAAREYPGSEGLRVGIVRKEYWWFTSDLINFSSKVWAVWVPDHPDFSQGSCVFLRTDESTMNETYWGYYQMGDCEKPLHYVCQMTAYETNQYVCGPSPPSNE